MMSHMGIMEGREVTFVCLVGEGEGVGKGDWTFLFHSKKVKDNIKT